jgi:hypothetical protein
MTELREVMEGLVESDPHGRLTLAAAFRALSAIELDNDAS